jgi:DNA-binding NtrC family response regulator
MCLQSVPTLAGKHHPLPVAIELARPRTETILLVEDETFVREVTCEVLRKAGYQVLSTKNADEAMTQYDGCGGEIDLLLTDVGLPGKNGRVLANSLTQRNSGLQVLYVTGYLEFTRCQQGDTSNWLSKPFSSEVLLAQVRRLLDERFLRRSVQFRATPACGRA